jgi:hypothetical protein
MNYREDLNDDLGELIRWAFYELVRGEEPSPKVWLRIKAKIKERRERAVSRRLLLQRLYLALRASALAIFFLAFGNDWNSRPVEERAYLAWRENLALSTMPMMRMMIY